MLLGTGLVVALKDVGTPDSGDGLGGAPPTFLLVYEVIQ